MARGEMPSFPHIDAPHVADWWLEIGPTVPGGMGECPLGWQDLAAWQAITGIELAAWEARAIRSMSREFVNFRDEARKADCPPPYLSDIQDKRKKVGLQVRSIFGGRSRPAT